MNGTNENREPTALDIVISAIIGGFIASLSYLIGHIVGYKIGRNEAFFGEAKEGIKREATGPHFKDKGKKTPQERGWAA